MAPVSAVIIDPADGSFLGIMIEGPKKQKKVIPAMEIKGFGEDFVMINDLKSISEIDDVIRIKTALETGSKIIGAKVETESGQKLGRVTNATIDLKFGALERLYVNVIPLISFLSKDLIISAKKIIEIQKNKIIVSDEFAKEKVKKMAAMPSAVPE